MRTLSDTASLNAAWVPLFNLVDAGLMAAYIDVVGDRTASAPARSLAASGLLTMQGDGLIGVSNSSLTRDGENCQVGYVMAPPATTIAPLTASHRQTIRATLTAVAADAPAPASVRSAVACVRGHLRPLP